MPPSVAAATATAQSDPGADETQIGGAVVLGFELLLSQARLLRDPGQVTKARQHGAWPELILILGFPDFGSHLWLTTRADESDAYGSARL